MATLLMLVGISGSGKTSVAEDYRAMGYEVFSSDAIREELWGDAADQKNPAKVFEVLHTRIMKALQENKNSVYDATNLSAKRRESFLNLLNNSGIECFKECCIVITPVVECELRDSKRARSVGPAVIERQVRQFEVPHVSEGWDVVRVLNNGTYIESLYSIEKEAKGTARDAHENSHHELCISDHVRKAADYVDMYTDDCIPYVAARWHDIGKYFTKSHYDRKGNYTDDAHYYNHSNYGAYLFLNSWSIVTDNEITVAFLIQHHMDHYLKDEKSMEKFKKKIGPKISYWLDLLEEADAAAH